MFLGRFGVVDLSGFKTEILRFRRNPTFQEKSYVSRTNQRFKSTLQDLLEVRLRFVRLETIHQ